MAGISVLCLLNAKTTSFCEPSAGGVNDLTGAEWAGLLCGLSDHVVNYARAKYLGDGSALFKLRQHTRVYAFGIANQEHWKIQRGKPIVYNLGALACEESVSDWFCSSCHSIILLSRRCSCGGAGIRLTDSSRARLIGVDKSNYSRLWSSRYERIYRYHSFFDEQLKIAINRR